MSYSIKERYSIDKITLRFIMTKNEYKYLVHKIQLKTKRPHSWGRTQVGQLRNFMTVYVDGYCVAIGSHYNTEREKQVTETTTSLFESGEQPLEEVIIEFNPNKIPYFECEARKETDVLVDRIPNRKVGGGVSILTEILGYATTLSLSHGIPPQIDNLDVAHDLPKVFEEVNFTKSYLKMFNLMIPAGNEGKTLYVGNSHRTGTLKQYDKAMERYKHIEKMLKANYKYANAESKKKLKYYKQVPTFLTKLQLDTHLCELYNICNSINWTRIEYRIAIKKQIGPQGIDLSSVKFNAPTVNVGLGVGAVVPCMEYINKLGEVKYLNAEEYCLLHYFLLSGDSQVNLLNTLGNKKIKGSTHTRDKYASTLSAASRRVGKEYTKDEVTISVSKAIHNWTEQFIQLFYRRALWDSLCNTIKEDWEYVIQYSVYSKEEEDFCADADITDYGKEIEEEFVDNEGEYTLLK